MILWIDLRLYLNSGNESILKSLVSGFNILKLHQFREAQNISPVLQSIIALLLQESGLNAINAAKAVIAYSLKVSMELGLLDSDNVEDIESPHDECPINELKNTGKDRIEEL